MGTKASVEMYLCAFHLGKWEPDESVEDAYHRALSVSAAQFHRMQRDDYATLQEKHAAAIHRMYEAAGVNLKTATEAEKAPLRHSVTATTFAPLTEFICKPMDSLAEWRRKLVNEPKIVKNSLQIPCLAGNLKWRPVRSGLCRQPASSVSAPLFPHV